MNEKSPQNSPRPRRRGAFSAAVALGLSAILTPQTASAQNYFSDVRRAHERIDVARERACSGITEAGENAAIDEGEVLERYYVMRDRAQEGSASSGALALIEHNRDTELRRIQIERDADMREAITRFVTTVRDQRDTLGGSGVQREINNTNFRHCVYEAPPLPGFPLDEGKK